MPDEPQSQPQSQPDQMADNVQGSDQQSPMAEPASAVTPPAPTPSIEAEPSTSGVNPGVPADATPAPAQDSAANHTFEVQPAAPSSKKWLVIVSALVLIAAIAAAAFMVYQTL